MKQKKKLSAKGWLIMFIITAALMLLCVPLFNFLVDPYGAFGDPVFKWWSYDETLNPRLAKISYLEQHANEYDSYIVGSSGSSSYPVEQLNGYLNAKFYNAFFYGTDMRAYEQTAKYLIENYTVKNLVLNLSPRIGVSGVPEKKDLTKRQYYKVDGSSFIEYAARYLFIDPMDSVQKIKLWFSDGYLQKPYRVFDEKTGAYDKSKRDAEPIGDADEYLEKEEYKVFLNYPREDVAIDGDTLSQSLASVARIRELCKERGIRLFVFCQPGYREFEDCFPEGDLATFRNELAKVTDYWDFTLSSVSCDPRYFYDATHFRGCVGRMALARVFNDGSVYVPDGFGEYVPLGSEPGEPKAREAEAGEYTVSLPVIMYHDISDGDGAVSEAVFREQMDALSAAGYTTVGTDELRAYTEGAGTLPEKPLLITFDDGYQSVYDTAYPILKEHGFKALSFIIGVSAGKDTYKDTGKPITPHFTAAQGKEMEEAGVVEIHSHGYNVHEVEGRDPAPIRRGVLQKEDETEKEYVAFLKDDCAKMRELLGKEEYAMSYPNGYSSELSEVVLRQEGVFATFTSEWKGNTLIRGMPQSLRGLGRITVYNTTSGEELVRRIKRVNN